MGSKHNKHNKIYFVDSEGSVEAKHPHDDRLRVSDRLTSMRAMSRIKRVEVGPDEERSFYIDPGRDRIYDINANEWIQLEPDTTPEEFLQSLENQDNEF